MANITDTTRLHTSTAVILHAFVWTITLEKQKTDFNKNVTDSDQVESFAFDKNTFKIVMWNKLVLFFFYCTVDSYSSLQKEQKDVSSVGI